MTGYSVANLLPTLLYPSLTLHADEWDSTYSVPFTQINTTFLGKEIVFLLTTHKRKGSDSFNFFPFPTPHKSAPDSLCRADLFNTDQASSLARTLKRPKIVGTNMNSSRGLSRANSKN